MKPYAELTITEIQFILHTHEFSSETERLAAITQFENLRKIIEFIQERVQAIPPLPCKCNYCEEIRAGHGPKKKEATTHFSLD